MNTDDKAIEIIQNSLSGEWRATQPEDPAVPGYTATFKQFQANAIVAAVNAAAEQAGLEGGAYACNFGPSGALLGDNPNAPRNVVIPSTLALDEKFQEQLSGMDMRQTVTGLMSQQLRHAATSQGLPAR